MQAGALTFLFTDIEASTRRWEADAAAMSAALAQHDDTLRTAITGAGGTVFKHTGDGMCAVFPSAATALAGAVAAQQQLANGPLRVRMAVHSGDVEQRGGDYFGPTLNRAARLLAAAWGGQTVVSAATAELTGDDLPAGCRLIDLGLHRLADLNRPERIFQLTGEEIGAEFPSLRTVSARRHNLPSSLTSFVGRDRELAEVADLLKVARLVTVTGVGGVGKTRLATEAAARALDGFPDGAFLVELAPVTDTGLVPATVAAALGLLLDQSGSLPDQLCAYLERRTALIVLDNCEHVVDAAAALAGKLLRETPGVVVLATSREPLGVAGEAVWRIPPLEPADAFELVCERARAADVSFSPSEADVTELYGICARLDGIPLALELAAARLHLLSPAEIAARLDDRFRLLTGGARTAVDRQRTLRATIDWGYDLLDEPSRSLLCRLSVCSGGFDLAAAEALGRTADDPDVLDRLGGLVDRSWVAVDTSGAGPARYHLIETIRQYADEKLAEAGEADDARRAHALHFRSLAEARGDGVLGLDPAWLRRARIEEDNLRLALEWCIGQGDRDSSLELAIGLLGHLAFMARGAEAQVWLRRALALEPQASNRRTLLAWWLLVSYWPDFEPGMGEHELDELLTTSESKGESDLAANIRASLAVRVARRDPARAAELVAGAGGSDTAAINSVWAANNWGWVWLAASNSAEAERSFTRALELARHESHAVAAVHVGAALAWVTATRGGHERARKLAEEAIEEARGFELPLLLVMALTRATEVHVVLGNPTAATICLAESLQILRDVGARAWVADSLELSAGLASHAGAHSDAARLLGATRGVDVATGEEFRTSKPGKDLAERQARQALSANGFAAEFAAGAALTVDEALTLARRAILAAAEQPGSESSGPA